VHAILYYIFKVGTLCNKFFVVDLCTYIRCHA